MKKPLRHLAEELCLETTSRPGHHFRLRQRIRELGIPERHADAVVARVHLIQSRKTTPLESLASHVVVLAREAPLLLTADALLQHLHEHGRPPSDVPCVLARARERLSHEVALLHSARDRVERILEEILAEREDA